MPVRKIRPVVIIINLVVSLYFFYIFINILIKTASIQRSQLLIDYLISGLIFLLGLIIGVIIKLKKKLSLTSLLNYITYIFGVASLYTVNWGRFFLRYFYLILPHMAFSPYHNFIGAVLLILSITAFIFLIHKEWFDELFLLLNIILFGLFFIIGYKYNVVESKEIYHKNIERVLFNNKNDLFNKEKLNLGTGTDIRYIVFDNSGKLYGCGGNQSISYPNKNIFSYDINSKILKFKEAVEVKYLILNEDRNELFYADFQTRVLAKLDINTLKNKAEVDLPGYSPQMAFDNRGGIIIIYDQPLIVERRSLADLALISSMDIIKSGLCPFGSIGISLSSGIDDKILLMYMGCSYGLIEINSENLFPLRRMYLEYPPLPWYITYSKKREEYYITNTVKSYISVLDARSLAYKNKINAGYGIRFILVSSDSRRLFAADYFSGKIYFINIEDGSILNVFQFGRKTYGIAEHPLTKDIYVAGPDGVWKIEDVKK